MTRRLRLSAALGLVVLFGVLLFYARAAQEAKAMLSHDVYFTLQDRSDSAKNKLVSACRTYLKDHPGEVFFAAGVVASDLTRDVNVTDFDVALHIVFKSKEDHDRYQVAEKHQKFITENQANWAKVRVFDSYVR